MPATTPDRPVGAGHIATVRQFNRFYTAHAQLLRQSHLGSGFALAEVRLLFEIAHRPGTTASVLCHELQLGAGHASRLVAGLERRGLVTREPGRDDRRRSLLRLTPRGRATFAPLDREAAARVRAMLAAVPAASRADVAAAMTTVRAALLPRRTRRPVVRLRTPNPGDLGWVVERHGALYAAEYGYDARFEGFVARIVADYVTNLRPARERCWIAEVDGARAGSVFLVRSPGAAGRVAMLRLLLVEPWARGLQLGRRLVRACTDFARKAHYRQITLWTQSELAAARKLYVAEGYRLAGTKRHADFGKLCVAETWELRL
jgi:DNA-binding MarR family transcriptional regulator